MAAAVLCNLMSSLSLSVWTHEPQGEDVENGLKRKRSSSQSDNNFKRNRQSDNMTDTTKSKRANFSALTPSQNGVNRNTTLNLQSSAKKLVIKNMKGNVRLFYSSLFVFIHREILDRYYP